MKTIPKIFFAVAAGSAILWPFGALFAQSWNFTTGPYRPHAMQDLSAAKVGSAQTIYAADTETLKVSTDGGSTWAVTGGLMLSPLVVATVADNPLSVHVAKLGELWTSSDGGVNWTRMLNDPNIAPLRISVSTQNPGFSILGADTVKRGSTWTTSLYRTSNAGSTWYGHSYFQSSAHTNANDVLFAPGSNLVYVGGSTKPEDQTPDMTNESGYCATCTNKPRKGIWTSGDGGASWSFGLQPSSTDRNASALAYSSNGGGILFAATTWLNGSTVQARLYQSVGGGNWYLTADLYTQQQISLVRAMKVNPLDQTFVAAATNKGFAVSTNTGVDWTLRNNGMGGFQTAYQVLFDKNDGTGNTIYLATYPTIYKTTDRGSNWSALRTDYSWMNTASISVNKGTAHAVSNTYSGIPRLSAGAWGYLPAIVGQKSFAAEATFINYANSAYANTCGDSATYGAIYMRSDGADGWRKVFTSGAANTELYALAADFKHSSQRVYAGGYVTISSSPKNFLYSADLGVSWQAGGLVGVDGSVPVLSFAIDTSAGTTYSNNLYAGLGSGLGVRKSTNAGTSWGSGLLNGNSISTIALPLASPSTLYLGASSAVWKSTDGLSSASQLTTPFTGAKKLLIHPSYQGSPNYVWAITGDGSQIYKTTDGGASWSQISTTGLPTPFNDLQSDTSNKALIYLATSGGVYSIDPAPETPTGFTVGGTSCTPFLCGTMSPSQPMIQACRPILNWNANLETDMAGGGYVLQRQNAGGAWTTIASTSALSFTDLSVTLSDTGHYCVFYQLQAVDAGNNSSPWTYSIGVMALFPAPVAAHREPGPEGQEALSFALMQNAPNPFNPVTSIHYSLPAQLPVQLMVYDVLGRQVAKLVDEVQSKGLHAVEFDASNVASGIYFYRLAAGNFTSIKRMILLK
jgi:photosystem II stability/assembly factor-like uncharacterized protein